MEKLTLQVRVDYRGAILRGAAQAGDLDYPLAGVLALLTDEERTWLASRVDRVSDRDPALAYHRQGSSWGTRIVVAEATDDAVVAVLRGERATEIAANAERAQNLRRDLATLTPQDLQYSHGVLREWDKADVALLTEAERDRYRALLTEAAAQIAERDAEREAEREAEEARRIERAEREAQEAREVAEARDTAIRNWATGCEALPPNLRRAAAEGCEIVAHCKRAVADLIRTAIEAALQGTVGWITPYSYSEKDASSRVPSDEAYAVCDALEAARAAIREAATVPVTDVVVGPRLRVDLSPSDRTVWGSAVRVTVTTEWFGEIEVDVCTEPRPDALEDEDE